MQRQLGSAACLLGRTWGYDDQGVWVTEGCSAEFLVRAGSRAPETVAADRPSRSGAAAGLARPPRRDAGAARHRNPPSASRAGASSSPATASWSDATRPESSRSAPTPCSATSTRRPTTRPSPITSATSATSTRAADFFPHRAILYFKGWVGNPKLVYTMVVWTVNETDQDALFGVLGYQFSRKFSLYGGINGFPGTRSLQGSHPLLARPRSGDGGRVLPALLLLRRLGAGRGDARALVQRHDRQQPERAGDQGGRHSIARWGTAARSGGCRPPTSSAPRAPSATGSGTRISPPVSASRPPPAPRTARPTIPMPRTTRRSAWPTA